MIQKLYRVEKQARRLNPEERYARRQQQARPVLDDLRSWLDDTLPLVPPTSATDKALGLEPYAYLRHLFTELPQAETVEAIEVLLPGNLDEGQFKV